MKAQLLLLLLLLLRFSATLLRCFSAFPTLLLCYSHSYNSLLPVLPLVPLLPPLPLPLPLLPLPLLFDPFRFLGTLALSMAGFRSFASNDQLYRCLHHLCVASAPESIMALRTHSAQQCSIMFNPYLDQTVNCKRSKCWFRALESCLPCTAARDELTVDH